MGGFKVEQRIVVERWKATVKYVGEVAGQQGTWIGLDWDDESRGKHDGSHNGHRYFSTERGRKSGSFVRESKLCTIACTGQTILSALQNKYGERETGKAHDSEEILLNGRVKLELVGAEKLQRQRGGIEKLEEVTLIDCNISSVGPHGELSQAAPCLRDIDLSSNLLSDWEQVLQLSVELQHLTVINVSSNKIFLPKNISSSRATGLRKLILNNCGLSDWQIAGHLISFPELEELHLMGNHLQDILVPEDRWQYLQSLKKLDLDDNQINNWTEVCKLGNLPNLEQLLLGNNGLKSVCAKDNVFPKLQSLTLSHNEIADWVSIDAFNSLPSLSGLRLTGNPHPANQSQHRYQAIARVGGLQTFNGSVISLDERKDAEIQLMRTIAGLKNAGALQSDSTLPVRLPELQRRYGDVGAAVCTDGKPKALKSQMLEVTMSYQDGSSTTDITKRLPSSLTLAKLKALCSKFFKVPVRNQIVKLLSMESDDDGREDITDCEARHLSYFTDKMDQGEESLESNSRLSMVETVKI